MYMTGKRTRTVIYTGTSFLAFLTIVYFFWIRPNEQLNNAKESLTSKEFIELKGNIRTGLAQALGGAALLIGLGFTWRSIKAAEKNLTIAQENITATQETAAQNIAISLEGQITDRFTKAIAQLGDDKLEIRLGGIFALERIAQDSEKDYWPIIEVLAAFVREKARWEGDDQPHPAPNQKVRADIQAVLRVISRRRLDVAQERRSIDLSGTDLRNAEIVKANLERANFARSHLEGAMLAGSRLEDTNLNGAHFDGAYMGGVVFGDTTRMKGATFNGALVTEDNLKGVVGLTPEQKASMLFIDLDSFLKAADEPTKRKVRRLLAELDQK
jgi:hypothetical protein